MSDQSRGESTAVLEFSRWSHAASGIVETTSFDVEAIDQVGGFTLKMGGCRSLLALVGAITLLLGTASAHGPEFVVDSTVDAIDAVPGDGICADAEGRCTLRAAVIESNQFAGLDSIFIPAGTYGLTIGGADLPPKKWPI